MNQAVNHAFDQDLACRVGIQKAVLIGNFKFWIAENERRKSPLHFHQNEYWTYTTGLDLAKKFPYMNLKSMYRWLTELEAEGWVKTGRFNKKNIDQTTWYARGNELKKWLGLPISQNENWEPETPPPISHPETPNSHFETPNSHFENPYYKETHLTTDLTTDLEKNTHAHADEIELRLALFLEKNLSLPTASTQMPPTPQPPDPPAPLTPPPDEQKEKPILAQVVRVSKLIGLTTPTTREGVLDRLDIYGEELFYDQSFVRYFSEGVGALASSDTEVQEFIARFVREMKVKNRSHHDYDDFLAHAFDWTRIQLEKKQRTADRHTNGRGDKQLGYVTAAELGAGSRHGGPDTGNGGNADVQQGQSSRIRLTLE